MLQGAHNACVWRLEWAHPWSRHCLRARVPATESVVDTRLRRL
jgi:hypothetical protein